MTPSKRYKLEHVSILVILKIDSQDRLINLSLIIDFLTRHFEVDIHILEVGKTPALQFPSNGHQSVFYEFIEDTNNVFHMTRYRNYLISKTKSDVIIHYDTDVLVHPESIINIVEGIKADEIDIGYPYDGRFYNVTPMFKKVYYQARSWAFLEKYRESMPLMFHHSLGGIFIASRLFYEKSGLENEKIVGWGPDDKDRFYKSIKAGARYRRTNKPLYHLFHPVLQDSKPASPSIFTANTTEYIKSLY